jgi:hypothetical protein
MAKERKGTYKYFIPYHHAYEKQTLVTLLKEHRGSEGENSCNFFNFEVPNIYLWHKTSTLSK